MYDLQTLQKYLKSLNHELDVMLLEPSNDVGITITT